jgi:hypothetical protein
MLAHPTLEQLQALGLQAEGQERAAWITRGGSQPGTLQSCRQAWPPARRGFGNQRLQPLPFSIISILVTPIDHTLFFRPHHESPHQLQLDTSNNAILRNC